MYTNFEAKEIVFAWGDKQIISKEAFITSMRFEEPSMAASDSRVNDQNIDRLVRPPSFYNVSLDLVVKEPNFLSLFFEDRRLPISQRKVKDCTIQELLFAIRYMIHDKKNNGNRN